MTVTDAEVTAMRVVLVDAMVDWAMPAEEKAAFLAQFDSLAAEVEAQRRRASILSQARDRYVAFLWAEVRRLEGDL